MPSKHLSNPYKIRLQSNSIKIFKNQYKLLKTKHSHQHHFTHKNQAFPTIRSSKNHPLTEPIKSHIANSNITKQQTHYSHYQSTHLTFISHTNREVYNIAALLKIYLKEINNMSNMTSTALQVTDFNFYGDNLIALKDNSTGEIYTAINSVLRGIGFTDKDQIRKRRDKWINDIVISKGICVFNIPTSEGVAKNDTPINNQEVYCISQRKLPLALAKINITPKMKQNQPELVSKLELYQDKCADVLVSVFIDHQSPAQIQMQPIIDNLSTLTTTLIAINDRLNNLESKIQTSQPKQLPKKKFSYWSTKMFPKYQLLTDYFNISNRELYKELFRELQNTYPDIDLNQIIDDYCYENHLDTCFTLDAIEHNKEIRTLYETMVDNLLAKYNLTENLSNVKYKTIFDN